MFFKVTELGQEEFRVVEEVNRFEHGGFTLMVAALVDKYLDADGDVDLTDPEVQYYEVRIFELAEDQTLARELTPGLQRLVSLEALGEGYGDEDEDEEDLTDEQIAAIVEEGE